MKKANVIKLSFFFMVLSFLIMILPAQAALVKISLGRDTFIYDSISNLFWVYDQSDLVNKTYLQQQDQIDYFNATSYGSITNWHLATRDEMDGLEPYDIMLGDGTAELFNEWSISHDLPGFWGRVDWIRPQTDSHAGRAGESPMWLSMREVYDDYAYNDVGAWVVGSNLWAEHEVIFERINGNNDGRASNGALDKILEGELNSGLVKIRHALKILEATDSSIDLTLVKEQLALTAKCIAVDAVTEAEPLADEPWELELLQRAKNLVVEGDALLDEDDYIGAVNKYQDALQKTTDIS